MGILRLNFFSNLSLNYIHKIEIVVIISIILFVLYIFYSLNLFKKH